MNLTLLVLWAKEDPFLAVVFSLFGFLMTLSVALSLFLVPPRPIDFTIRPYIVVLLAFAFAWILILFGEFLLTSKVNLIPQLINLLYLVVSSALVLKRALMLKK